jgi:hypothetical protein
VSLPGFRPEAARSADILVVLEIRLMQELD